MNRVQIKEARLLLDKLLEIELERLRQRFRPYKRISFLRNKVTIGIKKVKECKNYDSLQTLLIFYIYEFEKVVNKINKGEDQYNIRNRLSCESNYAIRKLSEEI